MKKTCFFLIASAILCLSCKSEADGSQDSSAVTDAAATENVSDNNDARTTDSATPDENTNKNDSENMDNQNETLVVMTTDKGDVKLRLFDDTPLHRDNFIKLAKNGFYDGLLFHRVIRNFMVQGGDPDSKNAQPGQMLGAGDPGYTIEAEIRPNHRHMPGALAAARQGDYVNPERRSSGSQFYIVTGDASHLDGQYTVFGEVVEGMDVIKDIENAQTDRYDRPLEDIRIISTKVVEK